MTQKLDILLDIGPAVGILMIIFLMTASIAIPTLVSAARRSADAKERICQILESIRGELASVSSTIKKRQA